MALLAFLNGSLAVGPGVSTDAVTSGTPAAAAELGINIALIFVMAAVPVPAGTSGDSSAGALSAAVAVAL